MIINTLFALLLTLAIVAPAAEPRCFVPGTATQEFARVTAVFSGKVVGRDYVAEETPSGELGHRLVVKIAVARVWKGDIYADETLYTSEMKLPNGFTQVNAEDFFFKDDQEYLIYALGKGDRLSTNGCTRSRELSNAAVDLNELGDGYEPKIRK